MFGRVGEELIVLAEWKDFGDSGGAGNEELTSRVSIPFVPLERSTDQYEVCLMSYPSRGANASKSAALRPIHVTCLSRSFTDPFQPCDAQSVLAARYDLFTTLLVIWQG